MKKISLTIVMIFFCSWTHAEGVNTNCLEKEYYPSGAVHYERTCKDGLKDGFASEYYENGKVKLEVNFDKGKLQGEYKEFYPSGGLKTLRNFIDGEIEGVTKQYSEDGKLTAELTRDRGQEGWWLQKTYDYHPNGNIKYEYMYNQKTHEGYSKDFHDNGQISFESVFNGWDIISCKNYDKEGNFLSSDCPRQ